MIMGPRIGLVAILTLCGRQTYRHSPDAAHDIAINFDLAISDTQFEAAVYDPREINLRCQKRLVRPHHPGELYLLYSRGHSQPFPAAPTQTETRELPQPIQN